MNKNSNAVEHLQSAKQIILQEIASISVLGRSLTPEEQKRLQALKAGTIDIESAIAHLEEERTMNTLITYKIVSDKEGKLKSAAKLACDFWNKFVLANSSIVIRLGIFTSFGSTIARAYKPYKKNGIVYGRVEFNTKYLMSFSETEIVGTIIHEIGHTLGFGWDKWMQLFDQNSGEFHQQYIDILPDLVNMRVETDYGPGTTLAHWDEERFDKELMTGFKDYVEHVLPITISVMSLLGHKLAQELPEKTMLGDILDDLRLVRFTRIEDAKKLDRDYFEETDIWEEIYTEKKTPIKSIDS